MCIHAIPASILGTVELCIVINLFPQYLSLTNLILFLYYSYPDINECESEMANDCDGSADCMDTIGGYKCSWRSGYEGDGFICTGYTTLQVIFSVPRYTSSDLSACKWMGLLQPQLYNTCAWNRHIITKNIFTHLCVNLSYAEPVHRTGTYCGVLIKCPSLYSCGNSCTRLKKNVLWTYPSQKSWAAVII